MIEINAEGAGQGKMSAVGNSKMTVPECQAIFGTNERIRHRPSWLPKTAMPT